MATQSEPVPHTEDSGSPFCADPNCKSCNELRKVSEQMNTIKQEARNKH